MPANSNPSGLWHSDLLQGSVPVPRRYHGVWQRTLLETPHMRDESTCVRWMQLTRWHADLRIPSQARASKEGSSAPSQAELQAVQQGFCGITQVIQNDCGEMCTWHRLVDYQPPEAMPDAGWMVFHNCETVEETGIHGMYREIWRRLPDSTGRTIAFAEPPSPSGAVSARWLIAGRYAMRVRPSGGSAASVEISFGLIDSGQWHLQHSTWPELEGQRIAFAINRESDSIAMLKLNNAALRCEILEWDE